MQYCRGIRADFFCFPSPYLVDNLAGRLRIKTELRFYYGAAQYREKIDPHLAS